MESAVCRLRPLTRPPSNTDCNLPDDLGIVKKFADNRMTVNGSGQTIIVIDYGPHGERVAQVARSYAPGAKVELIPSGIGGFEEHEVRTTLQQIAANPRNVCAVVLPWQVGAYYGETIPKWATEPGRGFEPELKALREIGVYLIASAGNDLSAADNLPGAGYPACSPYAVPAMGSSPICNRTHRGILVRESISSSLAAPVVAATIALLRSAGADAPAARIEGAADEVPDALLGTVQALNIDAALASVGATRAIEEKPGIPSGAKHLTPEVPSVQFGILQHATEEKLFAWQSAFEGKTIVEVLPSDLTIVRYSKNSPPKRAKGAFALGSKLGKVDTIGVTGGVGEFRLMFRKSV